MVILLFFFCLLVVFQWCLNKTHRVIFLLYSLYTRSIPLMISLNCSSLICIYSGSLATMTCYKPHRFNDVLFDSLFFPFSCSLHGPHTRQHQIIDRLRDATDLRNYATIMGVSSGFVNRQTILAPNWMDWWRRYVLYTETSHSVTMVGSITWQAKHKIWECVSRVAILLWRLSVGKGKGRILLPIHRLERVDRANIGRTLMS